MENVFWAIGIGYLIGSIQPAFILGKLFRKVDIRTLGHGNSGASNATQSLGIKFGVAVALIDILKGVLSIVLIKLLFQASLDSSGAVLLYLNGYSVILGHIFPFYMRFKGGKGTAALIGIIIGMNGFLGLLALLTIIIATLITDYIILGTLALTLYMLGITLYLNLGLIPILVALSGMFLSLWLHLPNYKRLQNGTESRVSSVIGYKRF